MSLVDAGVADALFLSLSSVASLVGRFHGCGGRPPLLLSRQPGGALALGCAGCHTHVQGVRDELGPLLRRRRDALQQTLGLDGVAQQQLLAVLRGQQETAQQQQQQGSTAQQQQQASTEPQQQERHNGSGPPPPLPPPPSQQQEGPDSTPGSLRQPLHSTEPAQQQTEDVPTSAESKAKAVYKSARCEVCSKVFYKRSNLRVHMLRHLGVRPHWCQKCGKSFSDPSTYSRHVASVCGGQRHLTCHVCGKAFYHQVHLKEHLRKHTGEKPYSCQECGKSYAYRGSLRRHRLGQCVDHGAAGSHLCAVCGKAFRRPDALAAHCRLHAGVTLPPDRQQQQQQQQPPRQQQQQQQQQPQQQQRGPVSGGSALEAAVRQTLTVVSAPMAGSPVVSQEAATQCRPAVHASHGSVLTGPAAAVVTRLAAPAAEADRQCAGVDRMCVGADRTCAGADRSCAGDADRTCGAAMQGAPAPILPTVNVTQVKSEMFGLRA